MNKSKDFLSLLSMPFLNMLGWIPYMNSIQTTFDNICVVQENKMLLKFTLSFFSMFWNMDNWNLLNVP